MEIFKIPFYAWRYSLRELHEYPFFEYSDSNLLREYTRENLNNSIISNWISKLLNRDPDYYKNLLLQSETSNVRRQLDYATKILISSVIKNDIGLRGSISPIFDKIRKTELNSTSDYITSIIVPNEAKMIDIDTFDYPSFSLIDLRKSRNDFIIPYSNDCNRIDISGISKKIKDTSEGILERLALSENFTADCMFVAIDFFIGNEILPLECHCPGRGIGLHLLPFVISEQTSDLANAVIHEMKQKVFSFYKNQVSFNTGRVKETTFHLLDRILLSQIDGKSELRKTINLDVNDDPTIFSTRDNEIQDSIPQIVFSNQIERKDIDKIKNHLGDWIVLKTRVNIPWWSEYRKKPEVLMVNDSMLNRINYLINNFGEVVIQKLITNSVDKYGHFGELRTFFFIMR